MKTNIIILSFWLLFLGAVSFGLAQQEGNSLTAVLKDFNLSTDGQKDIIHSSLGVLGVSDFSLAKIIAYLVFNGVGFVAFVYGKKQKSFKPLLIGVALTVYPYFLTNTFWLYAVGFGLCLLLYYWRD